MLKKVLRIIAEEGTASTDVLARRLGVSHALMQHMVEELIRQGYLKSVVGDCSVPCEGCPLHTACLYGAQARIWMLSSKGESLLARRENANNVSGSKWVGMMKNEKRRR